MKIEKPARKGGYNLRLFINAEEARKYICPICKNVLRNSVQVSNSSIGTRVCKNCCEDNIQYVNNS